MAIYDALLAHLAEADLPSEGCFVHTLPKQLNDAKILAAGWVAGVIEFGRQNYSETAKTDSQNTQQGVSDYLFEDDYSWTGPKSSKKHKPFRELIKEDDTLPKQVIQRTKTQDPRSEQFRVEKKKHPGDILRLRIRLTDKAFAVA